jgi:metal-responsive CopG/Arc/MetJ family transcriptional regulator
MLTVPVRTTILLQPSLLLRLKHFSKEQGRPMSEIVEQAVRHVIEQTDQRRLGRMYEGLFALAGKGKAGVRDASQSIDEELYGKTGAWKGSRE